MNEANLINFTVRPRMSARSFKLANVVEAHVAGQFCLQSGEDEFDLDDKIDALWNALKIDGGDFGLYHSDNSPTPHVMYSNDPLSLTGNQVGNIVFPANHNGEYSTGRDFAYSVKNEFVAAETLLMDYQETIQHIGTTGPRVQWYENKYWQPFYRVDSLNSLQSVTQSGYAVTIETWLLPPPPIMLPPFELQHLRTIRRTGPRRYPQGFEGYRIDWTYHFQTPTINTDMPTIR